jgi:hypothetical protein
MTVFRALRKHNAYHSFNRNSAFCVLPDASRFDDDGLWFYRSIGFSRHGNLADTVVALVNVAPAGYTAAQLAATLRTRVCHQLSSLVRRGLLSRQRIGRSVVFLATTRQRQQTAERLRLAALSDAASTTEHDPQIVLPVLVELLRHPDASPQTLAHHLQRRGSPLSLELLDAVFDRYDLKKKGAV